MSNVRISPKNTLIIMITILLFTMIVANTPDVPYIPTFDETRPVANVLTIGAASSAVLAVGFAARTLAGSTTIAWRISVKFMGWVPVVASAGVTVFLIANGSENSPHLFPWEVGERVIETVMPLALGLQAALIFSPPDEPALEITLACPRPVAWMLVERLVVITISQLIIVITGLILMFAIAPDADILLTLLRWIPPTLFFTGLGIYVTLHARLAAFGAVIVGVLWFILLLFTLYFLPGNPVMYPLNHIQPYLWVANPYLQPEHLMIDAYWLNRLCVTLCGIALIGASIHYLHDTERLLLRRKDD